MILDNAHDIQSENGEVLLRCSDVARILNISRSLAYRLLQSGDLVTIRIGTCVRVRPSDLQVYIAARASDRSHKAV